MLAMILKEFRELRRDRRTMAMLVVLPVVLLVIFGYAANFTVSSIDTEVVGPNADQAAQRLPGIFHVVGTDPNGNATDAQDLVRDNDADVVFYTGTTPPTAYVDGSNLFVAKTAVATLGRLGNQLTVDVLYNPNLKTS